MTEMISLARIFDDSVCSVQSCYRHFNRCAVCAPLDPHTLKLWGKVDRALRNYGLRVAEEVTRIHMPSPGVRLVGFLAHEPLV